MSTFWNEGAEMEAYHPIVAGGPRGFILHYQSNNQPLVDGELLLVDAGSQFDYYASDVTRTFPIGQTFTSEQKDIYQAVLMAQKQALAIAVPGENLDKIHKATVQSLTQSLIDLGVLKVSLDHAVAQDLFRPYYPHGTSHWIGMDVHDVGAYYEQGTPLTLKPGMYFSVEPGLYFNPNDPNILPKFRGQSVRIEDDILITEAGARVITTNIAKEIRDLEELRRAT
jgi:Xaa-Pro aminopeptidase